MSIFTRIRTALELANRVEHVEGRLARLEMEWGDTLDKLLAREERMRKRYRSSLDKMVEMDHQQPITASGGNNKTALRARLASLRGG